MSSTGSLPLFASASTTAEGSKVARNMVKKMERREIDISCRLQVCRAT
jgi:hypothetical protein